MSKQFKWLAILVAVVALALVVAWPISAAPSNATAGTIALDKSWATAVGTTITVTVTDSDLNVAGTYANEATDFSVANYAIPVGLANLSTWTQRVKNFPILDSDGNGVVNFQDIVSSLGGASPYSVDASGGLVTFQNTSGAAGTGQTFNITYKAAITNNTGTAVKVYSTTDTTGCTLQLNETGPNTGVFTNTFTTAAATACGAKQLIAGNGATITAAYTDASPSQTVTASATVETQVPTISNLFPASGSATSTTTQTLFADITDSQSGVVSGSIVFKMGLDNGAGGGIASNGILEAGEVVAGYTPNAVTTTPITGGYRAQTTTAALGENTYLWSVEANDNAVNTVVLDLDSTTAGNQAAKLIIDTTPPTYNGTAPNAGKTGEYWDAATKTVKANKTTSLSVRFLEALDGTTVDKSKFTVAGATPLDAFWTSDTTGGVADIAKYVFLTVPAQAPDAKPAVVVVGTLKDKAGNSMVPNVSATIQDGIAPTITAALDKTLVKNSASVILTIVSNEALATVPTVALAEAPATANPSPASVPAGSNRWTWTYTPGADGSYVLTVTGTDTSTSPNNGTAGVARCTALVAGVCTANTDFATKGIAFEADTVLTAPAVSAAGQALGANPNVYTANPFIVVDFTTEGSEYGISAANAVILATAGVLVTKTDTHGKATISKATLDGNNITLTGDANSVKFIYAASGLALGKHTLVVNGADEAGNVLAADLSLDFTVKARPSYSIPLVPGMNLISFPANPEKTALKDVFANTGADLVVTYDPSALAGPWLIAQKGADGNWTGTLAAADNLHGYWVRSSSAAPITANIPDRGYQDLPPSIPVVAGWNLVPVVSISGGAAPNFPLSTTTAIAAVQAFAGLPGIPTAAANLPFGYSYDPTTGGNWNRLLSGGNVFPGSAYWVYATAKGTITP